MARQKKLGLNDQFKALVKSLKDLQKSVKVELKKLAKLEKKLNKKRK